MVKIREIASNEAELAAKAEKWGNEAIPKPPRRKPYKAITVPFKTEQEYGQFIAAAKAADRKPTDFLKAAIKHAIRQQLKQE